MPLRESIKLTLSIEAKSDAIKDHFGMPIKALITAAGKILLLQTPEQRASIQHQSSPLMTMESIGLTPESRSLIIGGQIYNCPRFPNGTPATLEGIRQIELDDGAILTIQQIIVRANKLEIEGMVPL